MIKAEMRSFLDNKKISKRDERNFSKFLSENKKEFQPNITKCVICGKDNPQFCKSHSIPQFVLKGVSKESLYHIGADFTKIGTEKTHGLSNTLTFSCICRECDSKYFKEYEDESVFKNKISNIAINEIAVKTILKHYYKRMGELEKYKFIDEKSPVKIPFVDNRLLTTNIDIKDAEKRIKQLLKKKNEKNFYLIDEIDLDYRAEMAFQNFILLSEGFDGTINDIYNYDPTYKTELLFICIFPFDDKTKILLFTEEGSNRMKLFYKTYRKLSLEEKLYVINYIILLYDEEWCISNNFDCKKLNEETIVAINQNTDFVGECNDPSELKRMKEIRAELAKETFKLKTSGNIYNFLSKKEE